MPGSIWHAEMRFDSSDSYFGAAREVNRNGRFEGNSFAVMHFTVPFLHPRHKGMHRTDIRERLREHSRTKLKSSAFKVQAPNRYPCIRSRSVRILRNAYSSVIENCPIVLSVNLDERRYIVAARQRRVDRATREEPEDR